MGGLGNRGAPKRPLLPPLGLTPPDVPPCTSTLEPFRTAACSKPTCASWAPARPASAWRWNGSARGTRSCCSKAAVSTTRRRCRTSTAVRASVCRTIRSRPRACITSAAPPDIGRGSAPPWIRSTLRSGHGFLTADGRFVGKSWTRSMRARSLSSSWDRTSTGRAIGNGAIPPWFPLPLDPRVMWTKMWQFSPPTRFGARYRAAVIGAPNVHLYTHANVCELEANESLRSIEGLRVRTLDGKELRARARYYVLACCSIQNARLLLASNRRTPTGLGNAYDLVGRFFMEHIEIPSGRLALAPSHAANTKMYALEFGRTKARGELALSAAVQREQRILNATVSLEPGGPDEVAQSTFEWGTPDRLAAMRERDPHRNAGPPPAGLAEQPPPASAPLFFHLMTRQEQAPNPASRVLLSRERDALDMPRAKLVWRLTALARRSFRAFYEVMGRELGRSGAGRVQLLDWVTRDEDTWPGTLSGGWHHMGTTRMHENPRLGVVDANCRVHGLGNLYVAGASVYPTGGAANPTLTLVALSLRLSDHLKRTLA